MVFITDESAGCGDSVCSIGDGGGFGPGGRRDLVMCSTRVRGGEVTCDSHIGDAVEDQAPDIDLKLGYQ